jgi:hypothetical protein
MYPLMVTVSLLVDDIHAGVATLDRSIGLIPQRPDAYRAGPGIRAVFCRLHPKYAVSPTFLELVASAPPDQESDHLGLGGRPHEGTEAVFPLPAVSERQGHRAIKWHATELAMSDDQMADLARHIEGAGVSVGWHPPDRTDRFYAAGDPASTEFDPAVDGGLFIEAIKLNHLGLPGGALVEPADTPADARPESMIRIVARDYLVDDLDEVLEALGRYLRWEPSSVTDEDTCRRAVMPFSAPRSARLELVQPTGPGRAAKALDQLGPGAWTVRIAVPDVAAKAEDLESRGTPFSREDGTILVDPSATLDVPFEFVTAAAHD